MLHSKGVQQERLRLLQMRHGDDAPTSFKLSRKTVAPGYLQQPFRLGGHGTSTHAHLLVISLTCPLCESLSLCAGLLVNSGSTSDRPRPFSWMRRCMQVKSSFGSATCGRQDFHILAINHTHFGELKARGHAKGMQQSLQHLPQDQHNHIYTRNAGRVRSVWDLYACKSDP